MKDLKSTMALVQRILEEDKQARNSDSFLYLRVLKVMGDRYGFDFSTVSVTEFLQYINDFGVPSFETVRRSRQKVQAKFPDLAACEKVENARLENEVAFREFAKS